MKTFENAKAEDLMTLPFAENTVDLVIADKSGDIIVRFMNAVEVRYGGEQSVRTGTGKENRNED